MEAQFHAAAHGARCMCVLAVALGALAASAGAAQAATLKVDRDRAQCPNAAYTSIQTAVDAAQAGDAVRVCADLYPEQVVVDKPLTLLAQTPEDDSEVEVEIGASATGVCFDPAQAEPEPAERAVVEPAGEHFSIALRIAANDVIVGGFVVQGASVGIDASDRYSGYRIHHNLIRHNTLFGVDFGSEGTRESRVDHNCIRENGIGGVVSELDDENLDIFDPASRTPANARNLHNARIDHNDTSRTPEAIAAVGPGSRLHVRIDHNRSRADGIGLAIQNSTNSAIVENEVTSSSGLQAIQIGGGNERLQIATNRIVGATAGVRFDQTRLLDKFALPNTHVVVAENDIRNAVAGIISAPGHLSNSLISDNITNDNTGNGIILFTLNTDNVIRNNQADRNRVAGMSAFLGATGNRFEHNSMHANGIDARDFNTPINVWVDNDCATDNQTGAICGAG
jgi:hypothetical protein